MSVHWVLVGDAGGVRVFESDALLDELVLIEEITNDDRVRRGAGPDAAAAHHDPHDVDEEKFARAVAHTVNEADGRHRFERLIVAAPPRFLGQLRAALRDGTRNRVLASFHHDWTKVSPPDLAARIRTGLPDCAGLP